eukprot:TRINITY_DN2711_c1_g1_i1.p1 TRINITY_DN2711_c1_g1~~TRINITY_DN2711_c1_g1_i1.p1  ORF type:complete len:383 (-),score=67.31 TRINITY_DN2711_c1_g1_i1:75-1187(-)
MAEAVPPVIMTPIKPSFDSDQFVGHLLQLLQSSDTSSVPAHIASALQLPDYYIGERSSLLVDFYFSTLGFAAQHSFPVHKTRVFLQETEGFRRAVLQNTQLTVLRSALQSQLLGHYAERPTEPNVLQLDPKLSAEDNGTPALQHTQHPVPDNKPPPKKDTSKGTKHGKQEPNRPGEVAPPAVEDRKPPEEPVHYTPAEAIEIAAFFGQGLLQHRRLYCAVFGGDTENATGRIPTRNSLRGPTYRSFVETAMAPQPLRTARTEQQYVEWQATRRLKEDAAIQQRIVDEEQRAEQRRQEHAQKLAEEHRARLVEQELRDNTLSLSNKEVEQVVQALGNDVAAKVRDRHVQLLQRIQRLEEKMMPQPGSKGNA